MLTMHYTVCSTQRMPVFVYLFQYAPNCATSRYTFNTYSNNKNRSSLDTKYNDQSSFTNLLKWKYPFHCIEHEYSSTATLFGCAYELKQLSNRTYTHFWTMLICCSTDIRPTSSRVFTRMGVLYVGSKHIYETY